MLNIFNRRSNKVVDTPQDPAAKAKARQDAIDSYLASRSDKEKALEAEREAEFAGMDPAVVEYKKNYRATMGRLAKENADKYPMRRSGTDYLGYYGRRSYGTGNSLKFIAPIAVPIAFWAGMVALTSSGYDSDDGAQFLEEQGYTDVEPTGSSFILPNYQGCENSDLIIYKYETVAPNGDEDIDMIVCKGLFKGATTRRG